MGSTVPTSLFAYMIETTVVSGRSARPQRLDVDEAFAVDGQVGGLEALVLELLDGVEDGVVLDLGGDDVACRGGSRRRRRRGSRCCRTRCRRW